MRTRSALCAVAMTAALTVIMGGAAVAQPRQPAGGPARAASTNAAAAQAARQRISTTGLHLVSGGVRDMSGQALGGVCLLATAADGTVRMARTSAGGRYVIALPRAGAYSVRYRDCQPGGAAASAFAPLPVRQILVGASPVTALPTATLRQVSAAGDRAALAAAGVAAGVAVRRQGRIIRLRAGSGPVADEAGVSGSLAGGLTGRVTDPAGKPLAGICVWVISPTVDGTTTADGIETAANGTYDFGAGELGTGRFRILFTSACAGSTDPFGPIAPGPWAPEWYKNKFTSAQADKVALRANQVTRGINAVMRHTAKIGGVVTGSDGRPVNDACAVVLAGPISEVGQANTNARGAYTVTGLDPGSYRVLVVPGCNGPSVYGQVWYPRAQTFTAARAVTAQLGHLTGGINVVVPKLGTISGVIRLGGKTGRPLGGICIDVSSATNSAFDGAAVSGRDGTYSVEGIPAGSYQVFASVGCGNNGNYAPATYPLPVRVVNGKVASGINLYLQPGGTVSGTVTDAATGKPLSGICVSDDNLDFAVTNAVGAYLIDQLPAERTAVSFSGGCGNKGSYAPQFWDDQVTLEAAAQLTITAGQVTGGINAAMLPGATIAGLVTNAAGRPVSGVCISIVPADETGIGVVLGGNTSTIVSGSYVVANLAPGDYAVAFFSGCTGPSNAAVLQWFKGQVTTETAGLVDVRAGGRVAGIDAVVSPGGGIAGTVTSTTGQPVGFNCVTATNRRTGQSAGFQSLTGGGLFTVSSLPAGTYTVVAGDCLAGENLAQSVYPVPVTVRAGHTTGNIALKLPPGGAVTGRVTAASNGRPVPGVCVGATPVSAAAAGLGINGGALTSRSGAYRIVGLRTGSYRITVFPNCFGDTVNLRMLTLPHPVLVTQGKVKAGVNASLPAGGSIAGQVTGPGTAAVPGACAEAVQIPGGLAEFVQTDADGKYVVTGLAPGKYTVEFGDPLCSDGAAGLGIQWYNGAADSGSATVITVTAGKTASGVNAMLPADGTITGTVTGKSAAKLSGVCVSAVPVAAGEPAIFTVSGGGSYTLDGLLPGRYRVEFQAGCGRAGVTTQWWQDAASSAAAQIVTVSPGATVSGIDAAMAGA